MSEIVIDTSRLQVYANRLDAVKKRMRSFDNRIDVLYLQCGLVGLFQLKKCRLPAATIGKQARYLSDTVRVFEETEKGLSKLDPLNFREPSSINWKDDVKRKAKEALKKYFESLRNAASVGVSLLGLDAYAFGKAVVRKASEVKNYLVDNYKDKGWVYKAVGYGKAAVKVGTGIAKIVGGVKLVIGAYTAAAASGGVALPAALAATPLALLMIGSGVNTIINGVKDFTYLYNGEYEKVGTENVMKDYLVKKGGEFGEVFGNRDAGETFGEGLYYGIDFIMLLNSADKMLKSYGKVNTDITKTTGYSFVWGKTSFDDVFDNTIPWTSTSGFVRNILKLSPDSTVNFVYEAVENTISLYKKGKKFAKEVTDAVIARKQGG